MRALVVEVPALACSYLGCYGNEWVATPSLDRLAAEGLVFDQHIADCLGDYPSPWTGRYHLPLEEEAGLPPLSVEPVLFPLLQEQGVPFHLLRPSISDDSLEARGRQVLTTAQSALEELAGAQRWLLWVQFPSLHPPWKLPADKLQRYFVPLAGDRERKRYFLSSKLSEVRQRLTPWPDPHLGPVSRGDYLSWQRLQRTYAGVVSWLDELLGQLRQALEARQLLEEVLWLVTSPCGLALGEHGVVGDCRPWLHEEVVHVPLLLRLPGAAQAGRRFFTLTQPLDLLPTLADWLQVPLPASHGQSLLRLVRDEQESLRPYAVCGRRLGSACEWLLRAPHWAFLLPGPGSEAERLPQLYRKPEDRWEVNDLRQQYLEGVEQLTQLVRAFLRASRQPGALVFPPFVDPEQALAAAVGSDLGASPAGP